MINIAEFKETKISVLPLGVVLDALQSAEQQGLTHHVKVGAERIHNPNTILRLEYIALIIVCPFRQRVVQYLIESATYKLLTHCIGQTMLHILITLDHKTALQLGGNLDIIISVDTQDVLDHVTRTLHVNPVGGYFYLQSVCIFAEYFHFEALTDILNGRFRYLLAYQTVYIIIFK